MVVSETGCSDVRKGDKGSVKSVLGVLGLCWLLTSMFKLTLGLPLYSHGGMDFSGFCVDGIEEPEPFGPCVGHCTDVPACFCTPEPTAGESPV